MSRRRTIIFGILAGVPVMAVLAAVVVLPRIDLAPMAAARATAALGRGVTIDSLRIAPGLTLAVTLRGGRLDNIEGGSRPAMVEVARLEAALDLAPLLFGSVVVRSAEIDGLSLLLERAPGRIANWHFGARPPAGAAPAAPTPPDRSGLPMVHALRITGSEVTFRTSGGAELRTRIDDARLTAAGLDQPAALRAEGSYNAVPVAIEAALGSFATLRDARIPFPMTLRATAQDTALLFEGTSTDPLNVDGMAGRLSLVASKPFAILAMAGAGPQAGPDVPVELAGQFTRSGDLWRLTAAAGTLDGAAFTAALLQLTEGSAGQPDAIVAEMDFTRLDLNHLIGAPPAAAGGARGDADLPLVVPAVPDPLVNARIGARELVYAQFRGADALVRAVVEPARIAIEELAVVAFGGHFRGTAELVPGTRGGARIDAAVHMTEADIDTLRRAFGLRSVPVTGRLEAHLAVAGEATTLNAATREARISAVAAMTGGTIAREVIEMASTDVRALFRTSRGTTNVSCLMAAVDIRAGRGEAAPLHIRAGTGAISGMASFDLNRHRLDLIIGSHGDTTDFFALDVPIRVSGSFADPDIAPAQWSREARARMTRNEMAPLPPDLREIARRNPCYSGRSLRR